MKNLIEKSARESDMVMDFCAGTCLMKKTCMVLDQHGKLVRFSLDSDVLSTAEHDLLLISALEVLNSISKSAEGERVRAATR